MREKMRRDLCSAALILTVSLMTGCGAGGYDPVAEEPAGNEASALPATTSPEVFERLAGGGQHTPALSDDEPAPVTAEPSRRTGPAAGVRVGGGSMLTEMMTGIALQQQLQESMGRSDAAVRSSALRARDALKETVSDYDADLDEALDEYE